MITSLKYLCALFIMSLKSSVSLRSIFFIKMSFMTLNNLLFLVVWVFFFEQFETVRGWDIHYVALMYGIVAASFGIWTISANGLRLLAKMIDDGDLDTLLLQPKPILMGVAGSEAEAAGFGEILTGFILFGLAGFLNPITLPWILLFLLFGGVFFTALSILLGSLAFWFKDMNEWSRELLISVLFLGTWPASIYAGPLKIIIFTLIPVGFLSYLPIEFLTKFDWYAGLFSIFGITALFLISLSVFHIGLKRYESGNRFGVKG